MGPVFGVDFYWYRQNFALSRGMAHWHDLCWRFDRESHDLLHSANTASLSEEQCADKLSLWARVNFGFTANNLFFLARMKLVVQTTTRGLLEKVLLPHLQKKITPYLNFYWMSVVLKNLFRRSITFELEAETFEDY